MEGRVTFLISIQYKYTVLSIFFSLCHTIKQCNGTQCGKQYLKQKRLIQQISANQLLLKINEDSTVLILR